MKGFLPWLALLGVGGIVIWFLTKNGKTAPGDTVIEYPEPTATVSWDYGGPVTLGPGQHEIVIPSRIIEPEPAPEYIPPWGEGPQPGSPELPLTTVIPGELIPHTGGPSSWYEMRHIEDTLGWSPERFTEELATIRVTPTIERTAEQEYAAGYVDTMQAAEYVEARKALIVDTGGDFIGGILTVPSDFTGSVTEYSYAIRDMLHRRGIYAN